MTESGQEQSASTPADGGPAFPFMPQRSNVGIRSFDGHPGMTLRQWYAGQALGVKTAPDLIGYEDYAPEHRAELIRRLVRDCWEIADEMLRQRIEGDGAPKGTV
jgi:hypothetical protein